MQEKKRGRTHSRWLLPAALVLAGAAWFENFTLSTSTVTAACAALPEAFSLVAASCRSPICTADALTRKAGICWSWYACKAQISLP